MIQLTAIGTLGQDATIKDIAETKVINFSVAVNIGYGEKKTTQWIDCQKFGEKTGIVEYLKKGQKVYVSGTPKVQAFAKKDGTPSASLVLRVFEIELLGGKQEPQETPGFQSNPTIGEDLPF